MTGLTDKEIEEKLNSPDNLVNRVKIHEIERGRPKGSSGTMPMEIKKVIAVLGNQGEKQTDLAREFELPQPDVHQIVHGFSSSSGQGRVASQELKEVIQSTKQKVQSNRERVESDAIDLLINSVETLKPLIPNIRKPQTLSAIAKDMAQVANQMANRNDDGSGRSNVHLHIYRPHMKSVDDYEVIEVSPMESK